MNEFKGEVVSVILDKLEVIQKDVTGIKVEQAIIKTNLERSKEENIPGRVDALEAYKDKMIVWGAILMTVVPTGVTLILKKIL